jgi:hypothetical protein
MNRRTEMNNIKPDTPLHTYEVTVVRTITQEVKVRVEAVNDLEAMDKAEDMDIDYSSAKCEYEEVATYVTTIK